MEKKSWKMQMISVVFEMCRDVGACVRMWEIDNLWISFIESRTTHSSMEYKCMV